MGGKKKSNNFIRLLLALPFTDLSNTTIDIRLLGVFICFVKKVTNRHNRTLLVCYAASVRLLL